MTENEKARELIATSETTVKVDPQNGWYLKRFAALQFEGFVDNFGTNMPIHVLEQQLPKEDTVKLDDAVIEGQEIDYSRFYDEKGNEYSSVSELVQTRLSLDDDDAIQEYNKENPGLPYIPYEKLRDMDKKDIPEMLSSVIDEADYVDAYKEVTHVASYHVEVTPMSNNYETMGFAFTHQGLKEYEKSIDNHIFYPCRCYAHAGEKFGREAGDFYPIMEFLHSAGEQLLFNNISFTANPISSSDAIVLFLANQSEWAKEYVEKMLEEHEWSLKHIRRQVSIERYKEQKLAEYKKTPSEDLIQAKLFHDSVPKSGQVKVTLDIDGKQFVGSFDSKFFGYTGANLDEAILPEAGFKYPDSFEGYYEFLKDNGINIECKDGMFPFTFVKEIAAFRGDKIFWKREA